MGLISNYLSYKNQENTENYRAKQLEDERKRQALLEADNTRKQALFDNQQKAIQKAQQAYGHADQTQPYQLSAGESFGGEDPIHNVKGLLSGEMATGKFQGVTNPQDIADLEVSKGLLSSVGTMPNALQNVQSMQTRNFNTKNAQDKAQALLNQNSKGTNTAQMIEESTGFKRGTPQHKEAMAKYLNKSSNTYITTGGTAVNRMLNDKEKKSFGFSKDSNPYWNKAGEPKLPNTAQYTEGQGKSIAFGDRMQSAENTFKSLSYDGFDATAPEQWLDNIPLIGNTLLSGQQQQWNQAKRDWITAVLRKESGAVISDSEFVRENKKYFPVVGDTASVIAQKRRARETAIRSMAKQSGGGFEYASPYGRNGGLLTGGQPQPSKGFEVVQ